MNILTAENSASLQLVDASLCAEVAPIDEIVNSNLFRRTCNLFLPSGSRELVRRPACFLIRSTDEDSKFVRRLLLLQPHGYTADDLDLLSPHPEARMARIRILGKLNPTKKGFKPLVREVEFRFSAFKRIPTERSSPYARVSEQCETQLFSWKNWTYVVKENGWGYFHNLVNLSDEWVAVILEKWLTDKKPIRLHECLKSLPENERDSLKSYLSTVHELGDGAFARQGLVEKILEFPLESLVPSLIQMLNVSESGKHENCSFFALILKAAKIRRDIVLDEVHKAIALQSAPYYYLEDLRNKLSRA